MLTSTIFPIMLIIATLLSTLVTGLVLTFAIVTMPGIKKLNDREFIRAFQVMDGIIQDGQPIFMLIWLGSVLALIISTVMGFGQLEGIQLLLLIVATALYIFGMQLPTVRVNVPLNNQLQTFNVDGMDEQELKTARLAFEPRWNQWNVIRTIVACIVSVLLLVQLFML